MVSSAGSGVWKKITNRKILIQILWFYRKRTAIAGVKSMIFLIKMSKVAYKQRKFPAKYWNGFSNFRKLTAAFCGKKECVGYKKDSLVVRNSDVLMSRFFQQPRTLVSQRASVAPLLLFDSTLPHDVKREVQLGVIVRVRLPSISSNTTLVIFLTIFFRCPKMITILS